MGVGMLCLLRPCRSCQPLALVYEEVADSFSTIIMFEFDETFSDISSSSSTASFDFTQLLDPEEFQLLSRSLSLEALPSITDDDLPPFDDVPPFPLNRYLPNDRRHATASLDANDKTTVIPTTPWVTNVLKEPQTVETNAVCSISAIFGLHLILITGKSNNEFRAIRTPYMGEYGT